MTTCLVDTRAESNLFNEDYLKRQWKCHIKHLKLPKLRTTKKEVIKVQCVIPLVVQMSYLQARICCDIVQSPTVIISLGTTYIDKRIWGIFFLERKIAPEHSAPFSVLRRGTETNVTKVWSHEIPTNEHIEHTTIRLANLTTIWAEAESPVVFGTSKSGLMTIEKT